MAGGNQHYVIYAEPYRLYIYGGLLEQVLPLDLPTNVVRDLEVLNKDQLYTLVDACITTNQLGAGTAVIVLSERHLFEKQLVQDLSDENKKNEAIKEYTDNVPFEEVAFVTYPTQNGVGVIATNEELFTAIKRAFEKKGIIISLILPIRAYGDVQINPQAGLDVNTAAYLLQNADQGKQYAYHMKEMPVTPHSIELKKQADNKQASKRMPIYLSVFGALLLILFVTIVVTRQPPPNKPTVTNVDAQAPAAAVQQPAEPPPAQGSASAALNKSTVKIQLKAPALFKTQINDLKSKLTAAGYGTVDVLETPASAGTVLFLDKTKLTQAQRDVVTAELKVYAPHLTVQEVEQAAYDAVLSVGNEL